MTLTLLTAVDHRHEAQLVAALEVAPDIRVVRRCADTPELLSVAASGAAAGAPWSMGRRPNSRRATDMDAADGRWPSSSSSSSQQRSNSWGAHDRRLRCR